MKKKSLEISIFSEPKGLYKLWWIMMIDYFISYNIIINSTTHNVFAEVRVETQKKEVF